MVTHRYTSKVGALIGVNGIYADSIIRIGRCVELKIGRDPAACDVAISSDCTNISRVHCAISYDSSNDVYTIKDTSTNGTIIINAGEKTLIKGQTMKAHSGNVICLGDNSNSFKLF